MNQELTTLIDNSLIEKSKADYIKEKFESFSEIASEWSRKAMEIVVTEESQTDLMKQAKESRLLLKSKRIEIEKTRKSLKEQSLNEGRLIDGIAKTLIAIVEPAEKHLEIQEQFAFIQEQKRKAETKLIRYQQLLPYASVLDPNTVQLDIITDEAFDSILKYAKTTLENKIEADRLAEEEKAQREQRQSLFNARDLEIRDYHQYLPQYYKDEGANALLLNIETSQEAYTSLLEKLKAYKVQDEAEKEAIKIENENLKKQVVEIKEKTNAELEEVKETYNATLKKQSDFIGAQSNAIKTIVKKVITETDIEVANKKLAIATLTLQNVLTYIVHDDLRKMVESTLKQIK